jgi:hypothetical protein
MNEILRAKGNRYRKGRSKYNDMKAQYDQMISSLAVCQPLDPLDRAYFTYFFFEPNTKRDPSNFASGALKLIEDGLQKAGVLKNDGWKNVLGISSYWAVDKSCPGVMVYMTDAVIPEEEAQIMMMLMMEDENEQLSGD